MMSDLNVGDLVRWDVDVDKVYSAYTKTFVGKVGVILPPQEYTNGKFGKESKKHLTYEGLRDVEFSREGEKGFIVGNIPEDELVKVDAPQ